MTSKLQAPVGATELREVLTDHRPREDFILKFHYTDIETAVEFWLNNVVLRHPVDIGFIEKRGSDYVIGVMPLQGARAP